MISVERLEVNRSTSRWVGGMPVALPYSLKASALRISTWIRASCEALGLSTGGTSTPISFSRRPGVPSVCSAYIGWKQPAVSAANPATTRSRAAIRMLANDIHDRHGVFNQQIAFDLGPLGLRNQARLPQHGPALFRQMRHHRRDQLNQDDRGLAHGPGEIRRRPPLAAQHLAQRIGKFPDVGKADVEMQLFDAGGNPVERPMRRLAKHKRVGTERCRPG